MSELDTFVLKFKQLWRCGHEAQLNVEAKNGKAWVDMRLCLDDEPGPLHDPFKLSKFKISPSRERRKIRREAARRENSKKESDMTIVTEEATNDLTEDKIDVVAVEAIERSPKKVNPAESVDEVNSVDENLDPVGEVAEGANRQPHNEKSKGGF